MIYDTALKFKDELIEIRRNLHQTPETGFNLDKTSAYIEDILNELGIESHRLCKTGIVALIKGKSDKKTLLIRADIDALPVTELNDIDYKSKNEGKMHACGHDAHAACLIGLCKILKEMSLDLDGNIKLVFQPAEECVGGADPMINEGVMENPTVTAAVALHVEPLADIGTIQIRNGAIMASPDEFTIKINGVGGHGACPEDCNNPIIPASKLISKLNSIIEDNFKNKSECVVSVCAVNAGNSTNIIPESVKILGTARSLSENVRLKIEKIIGEYVDAVCKEFNCSSEYEFKKLYPPVINDSQMNDIVINASKKISALNNVVFLEKSTMTGDDFSYFANLVPSSYFKLGVGNKNLKNPLHSPYFNIDEDSLVIGAAIFAQIAIDYLSKEQL